MHKYLITVLLALVFAVPGIAKASSLKSNCDDTICNQAMAENPEMDPQLVEAILRAAAEECEYSYVELNDMYETGILTIGKNSEGYLVSDGGGLLISILDETI
jgi:hypothetical protein